MPNFEIVDLKDITTPRPPTPEKSKLLDLPAYIFKPHIPNPSFYGREDAMEKLNEALRPSLLI